MDPAPPFPGGSGSEDTDGAGKVAASSLAERDERIRQLTEQVEALTSLHGSTALAAASLARHAVVRLVPPGTRRNRAVGSALRRAHRLGGSGPTTSGHPPGKSEANRYFADEATLAAEYRRWRAEHEPGLDGLAALRRANILWEDRPLVSVVLAASDRSEGDHAESIDSMLSQVYGCWELWVVGEGVSPATALLMARYMAADPRIRWVDPEPGAGGLPAALARCRGEWVLRLDPGDVLRSDALHQMMAHAAAHDDEVVYGDDDRLDSAGARLRPECKPDWSPDYLLARDYLGPATAVRRSLLEAVGGWGPGAPSRADHDLHLRLGEHTDRIGHVARVLSSRRASPAPVVPTSADNPVVDALHRRGRPGRATPRLDDNGELMYDLRYELEGRPSVDIVIPTRDRVELLRSCIGSIRARSTYPEVGIIVVDNDSAEESTHRYLAEAGVTVVPGPGPFNFSRLVNAGVRASRADYVVLLNNDVTVVTPDWIEALMELGQQPEVGAVGCRLVFPDGSVQHEGVALLPEYTAANVSWPWPVIRDASAVTAACMLVRRDVYWSIDGFDEGMGVVYNDVDFGLRMNRSGRRVLYTPYAELVHDESASRGSTPSWADVERFFARWGRSDRLRDPYISPHVLWPHPQRLRLGAAGRAGPG